MAHEGVSTPKDLETGLHESISWPRKAIESIKTAIQAGVKLFMGHGQTNSHSGRKPVAEVIGKGEFEKDNKLFSYIVAYFSPENRKYLDNDVVSMEADVSLSGEKGNYIADMIDKITGIALGNSKQDKPAWAGAREIASIQAFGETKMAEEIDPSQLTRDQLRQALRGRDLAQIFDPEFIFGEMRFENDRIEFQGGDREFQKYFIKHAKNYARQFMEKATNAEKEKEKLEGQLKEHRGKTARQTIEARLKEKGEAVAKLGSKRIDRFNPEGDLEKEIEKFIEEIVAEEAEIREIYGKPADKKEVKKADQIPNPPQDTVEGDDEDYFLEDFEK